MGDEPLNPYLPKYPLEKITDDNLEADVETKDLYELTKEKFDIYHIAIDDFDDCYQIYKSRVDKTFKDVLKENYKISTLDELPSTIVKCIENSVNGYSTENSVEATNNNSNLISW